MFIRHLFFTVAFTIFSYHAQAAKPIIVSQDKRGDFQGTDDKPIQAAIDKAVKQGGGDILIRAGTYEIKHGIMLKDAQHIALRGGEKEGVILKLMIRQEDAAGLIELRGKCEDVLIAKLTLDGGRTADGPPLRASDQLCGVLAAGACDLEKGRTGPPLKQIGIQDCIIQNMFGRGIAFCSVEEIGRAHV